MSKTPRSDAEIKKIPLKGVFGVARLCEELEIELAGAQAEIERKDKLIEQMRKALDAADGLIDEYAADYEHRDNVDEIRDEIKAALSAQKGASDEQDTENQ